MENIKTECGDSSSVSLDRSFFLFSCFFQFFSKLFSTILYVQNRLCQILCPAIPSSLDAIFLIFSYNIFTKIQLC